MPPRDLACLLRRRRRGSAPPSSPDRVRPGPSGGHYPQWRAEADHRVRDDHAHVHYHVIRGEQSTQPR
eukprot:7482683-Alexandrium_andersonii.AAC.1